MKLLMGCVDALDPQARDAVRAAVPAEDLALVESAAAVSWLPVDVNLRATEAVAHALSPQAFDAFFRRLGDRDFDSTLLKSVVTGAIGVFGLEPSRLMSWVPRGWSQIFRDQTEISITVAGAGEARMSFVDLPAQLAASRAWRDSVAASMTAFFRATKREGTTDVESFDARARAMVLLFRWR